MDLCTWTKLDSLSEYIPVGLSGCSNQIAQVRNKQGSGKTGLWILCTCILDSLSEVFNGTNEIGPPASSESTPKPRLGAIWEIVNADTEFVLGVVIPVIRERRHPHSQVFVGHSVLGICRQVKKFLLHSTQAFDGSHER